MSHRRTLVLAAACAAVLGLAPAASAAPTPDQLATAETVALGARTGDAPGSLADIDAFENLAGRDIQIISWSQGFGQSQLLWPREIANIQARDLVPMIAWSPWNGDPATMADYAPRIVTAGRYDAEIVAAAREAADYGRPLFIRFAPEMNGDWFPWGHGVNGTTPAEYIAMWRHVVGIFRQAGATNVRWVWSPNIQGYVRGFSDMYPGDDVVDWVALDGYNWGLVRASGWRGFADVFGESYAAITQLTSKPLMIAEVGSTELGGDKAAWIADGLGANLPARFPRVRALIWFNVDRETDWRVNSSAAAQQAFRAAVSLPFWGYRGPQPQPPAAAPAPTRRPAVSVRGDRIRTSRRSIAVRVECRRSARRRCHMRVLVRRNGKLIASGRLTLRGGQSRTVRIRLNQRGRRLVRNNRRMRVVVTIRESETGRTTRRRMTIVRS